jgi:hypothetical protein
MPEEKGGRVHWVVALLLGLAATALWDVAAKPLFLALLHGLISLLTAVSHRELAAIYTDIARGPHEHSAHLALLFVVTFMVTGLLAVGMGIVTGHFSINIDDAQTRETRVSRPVWLATLVTGFVVFLAGVMILRLAEATYIARAIGHFEIMVTVTRPYMSQGQEDRVRSQFAQINCRADYAAVVRPLEVLADSHRLKYIPFDPY